jgi:hypothetical protein
MKQIITTGVSLPLVREVDALVNGAEAASGLCA